MKKKGIALTILMSLAMAFAMMPMMAGAAYADSEVVDAGIKYTLHDNGEATVSGYTEALQDSVIIPDTIRSGNVDYVVTNIGDDAFRESRLTSITIPEKMLTIESSAFLNSNLETVTFAEGSWLDSIEHGAFRGTEITSIILPEGITILERELFCGCLNLKEVSIPSRVNEMEFRAFYNCNALEKIYFGGSMSQWDAITGEGKPAITPILCVYAPAGKTLIYNGEEQTGVDADTRYTLSGTVSAKAAGSYQATATLNDENIWPGGTTDPKTINWKIEKANNPLSIKGRAAVVKHKKLKKKARKLAVTKVIKFTNKGQGKLTYTKASGNKKITIAKTTGKVTVKKGLKKGTYKVKVNVRAVGNTNYNASAWKTATFKIKVK